MTTTIPRKTGDRLSGRIVAAFGRHYEVAVDQTDLIASTYKCYPRGKKSPYACGDRVEIELTAPDQGVIVQMAPRENLLWRSDAFREKLIAANLDQVVIVVATEPGFSDLFVSRCIVAAESQGLDTLIVLNKSDVEERLADARARLAPFVAIGYPVLELSARNDVGPLRARLAGRRSILVGQSGMGKSTLTNALIPDARAATREISAALDSGKHTTTLARLYSLPEGGWLIDSPGMQAFGLAHLEPDALAGLFRELQPHLGECRFRDCRHEREPGCALQAAVAAGSVDARRFEHFNAVRDEIRGARKQAQGW